MSYYVVVPAPVRHDESISDGAKLLFGDLRGLGDRYGYCFSTNEHLASVCGVTKRQIRNYLSELEAAGHITIDRADGRKIFTVTGKDISGGVEENCRDGAEENCHHTNTPLTNTPTKSGAKRKRFSAPTYEDVKSFALEKNLPDHSEQFVDHYTATGWMMGKRQMKDWRAAYRNWCRNERKFGRGGGAASTGSLLTWAEMHADARKRGLTAAGVDYEAVPQGGGKPLWRALR